jgi:signal transduction histidine kinase
LLHFIEAETARALALGRVRIVVRDGLPSAGIPFVGAANSDSVTAEDPGWVDSLLETAKTGGLVVLQGDSALRAHGYELGYPLRRDDSYIGLMLVAASPSALTPEARSTLEVLAGQVAVAIEDSRLVEENLRLERTLAERERLAALGQMAASVAHEVKNPLSAIKSIAQVMGEDEGLSEGQARDLKMIVGETDRLSQTVTELLSFARREPPPAAPAGADDLTRAVADFFRADANLRRVTLDCVTNAHGQLNGMQTTAVREALQNLVMNAVQATPPGGRVKIETFADARELVFAVTDGGPGVPVELETRIWEPFFTTRQRGTGLGLAIVRKRMAETGGTARLVPGRSGEGARFELRVPSQYHTS